MAHQILRFEHIDTDPDQGSDVFVPDGYAGFQWENMGCFDTTEMGPTSGYAIGTHSGTSVAFNASAQDASFFLEEGTFTLKSGYFTAAFLDETIKLVAYLDGERVGSKKIAIDNTQQTFAHFGDKFAHIDEVVVKTGGGPQSQVAIDDLKIEFDPSAEPMSAPHVTAEEAAMNDAGLFRPFVDQGMFWMLD
jgi:hypothetical protein